MQLPAGHAAKSLCDQVQLMQSPKQHRHSTMLDAHRHAELTKLGSNAFTLQSCAAQQLDLQLQLTCFRFSGRSGEKAAMRSSLML